MIGDSPSIIPLPDPPENPVSYQQIQFPSSNVLLVPILIGLVLLLGRWVFGLEPGVIPAWVR